MYGEQLRLPVVKEMVNTVIGKRASKERNAVSLSNNTVQHRTKDMADLRNR
jgi:hypothetical protein